jgi:23S rRNA (cytosine1962-C5)-methyltransferase
MGLAKYRDLNRLAARAVRPGGLMLTCSCSGLVDLPTFTSTVHRAASDAGRRMQVLRVAGAGPDHPVEPETPQSGYLKALWLRLD